MNQEWNVNRCGERCAACSRAFDVGEWVQTVLYARGEAYERRDFCAGCAAGAEDAVRVGAWRARRAAPAAPKARPIDREALLEFFRRLESDGAPERVEFRFVLALLLWRKKVLRLEGSRGAADADAPDVWTFVQPSDGTRHAVVRPEIADERVDRLSESLESLLSDLASDPAGALEGGVAEIPAERTSVEEAAGA